MIDLKFSILLQHLETGRIVEKVFDYGDVFIGAAKIAINELTGYAVIARRVFTGQLDCDGDELFEGDIIRHGESIRFIEQRDSRWLAIRPCKTEAILLSFSNPKKLGNIYENPELLKP